MNVEPREQFVEEASSQLEAEENEIRGYLSGHGPTVQSEPELGMMLSQEFGAAANLEVREEVEGLIDQLYDENIELAGGEITIEQGVKQAYEILEGYEASDCAPITVAAGAVHATERFNAWKNYHSQNEIAETADVSAQSVGTHSKAMQKNYVSANEYLVE